MTYYRTNAGAAALGFARQLTGLPYRYGGEAPGPTDCSGLCQWAYGKVGIYLPRTSEAQCLVQPIPKSWASQPGDLLFIAGDPIDANPGHVMIFVAPGTVHGAVFEAEMTGTKIGQFAYDTDNFEFRTRPALELGNPPAPKVVNTLPKAEGTPTAAQLKQTTLVLLKSVAEAEQAMANGWHLWYFAKTHFEPQVGGEPTGCALYAEAAWRTKK